MMGGGSFEKQQLAKGSTEGDSDDEGGSAMFDLSPQELAELKERTANRSVHAIVKEGSLSQLRVLYPVFPHSPIAWLLPCWCAPPTHKWGIMCWGGQVKVAENVGLINLKDEEGQTPLHVACLEHPVKMDIVRFLLANNADVNAIDSNGWAPLHGRHTHTPSLLQRTSKTTTDIAVPQLPARTLTAMAISCASSVCVPAYLSRVPLIPPGGERSASDDRNFKLLFC
jgi:hypothetical protein